MVVGFNSTLIYNIVIINMNCWGTRNLPFCFVFYHNLKLNKYFIQTTLNGRQHNSNHTFQDYTNLHSDRSMSSVYIYVAAWKWYYGVPTPNFHISSVCIQQHKAFMAVHYLRDGHHVIHSLPHSLRTRELIPFKVRIY